jgi:hypothetical protein
MTTTSDLAKPIEEIYILPDGETSDLIFDLEWIETAMARDFEDSPTVIIETRKAIQYYLDSDAELIGYGRTRICFAHRGARVVKIPFTREGYQASSREVSTYENFQKDPNAGWIPTAECRFFKLDFANIWLLSMERVVRPEFGEPRPDWVDSVDCGQVGYNSAGELVAYDL